MKNGMEYTFKLSRHKETQHSTLKIHKIQLTYLHLQKADYFLLCIPQRLVLHKN